MTWQGGIVLNVRDAVGGKGKKAVAPLMCQKRTVQRSPLHSHIRAFISVKFKPWTEPDRLKILTYAPLLGDKKRPTKRPTIRPT
jgi:hypothetical protein